ncbi:MAG: cell wall-binding repeat-containing protein, partial [Coriobacteriales bacterium]|nr:cell wall-binding repeat-containing protein [Coriobacteriales bacterium]
MALANDINLEDPSAGTNPWTPIGTNSYPFTGTFDGQGHTISGLHSASDGTGGIFNYVRTATIENFVVKGRIESSTTANISGVVANLASGGTASTTIRNVGSEVDIIASSLTNNIGGIIATPSATANARLYIEGCYNRGTILTTATSTSNSYRAGGIVGYAYNYISINNCYNEGDIEAHGAIGGIVGYVHNNGTDNLISNSYNSGELSHNASTIENPNPSTMGAIVGYVVLAANTTQFSNLYYLLGSCVRGSSNSDYTEPTEGDRVIQVLTAPQLSLAAQVAALTDEQSPAPWKEGNRYPVLSWEKNAYGTPVITTQPAASSHATQKATPTALSVVAEKPVTEKAAKEGTLSWQWYESTTGSTADGALITGARQASYSPSTAAPGFTWYYCEIRNTWDARGNEAAGSESVISTLSYFGVVTATTAAKPEISEQPLASQSLLQHAEATDLTVVATVAGKDGAGSLSYQWYKSTTDIFDSKTAEAIKDARTETYTPPSNIVGTLYYFCVITNTLEEFKSDTAITDAAKVQVTGIQISSPAELLAVADAVNSGSNLYTDTVLELTRDIDLASNPDTASWTPIGKDDSNSFQGSLYGNGHTISGLFIDAAPINRSYLGLFGCTQGATLRDFVVKGSISMEASGGTSYVGGVVAYSLYSATQPYVGGAIRNVGSEVDINANSLSVRLNVGGVVGYSGGASYLDCNVIDSCYYKGTITDTGYWAGGIAGREDNTSFKNCYNTGRITINLSSTVTAALYVGGLLASSSALDSMDACYSTARITVTEPEAGQGPTTRSIGAILADTYMQNITRTFYHEDSWTGGLTGDPNENIESRSGDVLQSAAFLEEIDPDGLSYKEGALYPVLKWEADFGSPVITSHPEDGWAEVGSTATALSIAAENPAGTTKPPATGTLTHQWYRSTTASTERGVRIEGATSTTYTPPTATEGEAWYYCVVTNSWSGGSASATSNPARFIVTSAINPAVPVITEHPADAQYTTGDAALALQVAASVSGPGAGSLSYQWYALTGESPNPETDVAQRGQTTTSFMPPTTLSPGTYGYYCVVTNTFEGVKEAPKASYVAYVTLVPITIGSAAELLILSQAVNAGNSYAGCTIELTADIDLAEVCGATFGAGNTKVNWLPIGLDTAPFSGTFDGRGYSIRNLYYSDTTSTENLFYQGLFGYISRAELKNFVVDGRLTTKMPYTSGVVAESIYGSLLQNVGSKVVINSDGSNTRNAASHVGGLVGLSVGNTVSEHLTLLNCYNQGSITTQQVSNYVGGLVGYGEYMHIEGCYNTGAVSTTYSRHNGGLIGGGWYGSLRDCYVTGVLTAQSAYDNYGAISGDNNDSGLIDFHNNYYLQGISAYANGGTLDANNQSVANVAGMQSQDFVDSLNRAGEDDATTYYRYVADSYPKLYWEDTTELAGAGYDIEGIDVEGYDYTGSAWDPSFSVTNDRGALIRGTDYTVSYSPNNISVGEVTLTVTGTGNYRGRLSTTFDIKPVPLTVTVNSAEKGYSEPEPAFTGEAPGLLGSDSLAGISITRETGEDRGSYPVTSATVLIEGAGRDATGNYDITVDYAEATLTINALDLAGAGFAIGGIEGGGYAYTGSAITPEGITVARGATTLDLGADYTLSYANHTNAGTATVTVTGQGNYTGELSTDFTINALSLPAAGFAITGIDSAGYPYTGSAITPKVSIVKGATTLNPATDYTVSYSSNTAVGIATLIVTGKGNYQGELRTNFTIKASEGPGIPDKPEKQPWPRLDGNKGDEGNRFDTMQAIVGEGWSSSNYVIVASGMNFPDALAASSLAGIYGAPVILTETGGLTSQAQETIQSLGATKAFIIGGEAAVSPQTFAALEGVVGQGNVSRISGEGRIETALDIYEKGKTPEGGNPSWGDTAIIANGFNFADALSISPYAHVTRSPIFLSTPDTYPGSGLDEATLAALTSGGFKRIIITGGIAAVPALVEDQLAQTGVSIERWSGDTRYETSVDIVEKSLANSNGALSLNNLVCATGDNYPDALAGGAFAGHTGTVLL